MICTCLSGWSKVPARIRSRPCSGLFMRSSLPIPALAFLALALSGCEVQPVVSNVTPPPAVQAVTPPAETIVTKTTVTETGSQTGDGAGVIEIVSEAEPATAIEETGAVADTAAEQDDPAAETADTGQADSTKPVTAPATPAAKAGDAGEVAGKVAGVVQTGAGEQAEEEVPRTGALAMAAPPPPLLLPPPPPRPPPPPTPTPPELAPSSLIGISIPVLQSRLGEADFTRTEGEIETWQYRFETCVVDYFLVVDSEAARIVSWAWRAPVIGVQVDETACRRALAGRDAAS